MKWWCMASSPMSRSTIRPMERFQLETSLGRKRIRMSGATSMLLHSAWRAELVAVRIIDWLGAAVKRSIKRPRRLLFLCNSPYREFHEGDLYIRTISESPEHLLVFVKKKIQCDRIVAVRFIAQGCYGGDKRRRINATATGNLSIVPLYIRGAIEACKYSTCSLTHDYYCWPIWQRAIYVKVIPSQLSPMVEKGDGVA